MIVSFPETESEKKDKTRTSHETFTKDNIIGGVVDNLDKEYLSGAMSISQEYEKETLLKKKQEI